MTLINWIVGRLSKLPWWLRSIFVLASFGLGVLFFFAGWVGLAGVCAAIGVLLILFGPSDAEKRGYKF